MTEKAEKGKGEFVILPCTEKDIPGILKIVEEADNTLEHREWYVMTGRIFLPPIWSGRGLC